MNGYKTEWRNPYQAKSVLRTMHTSSSDDFDKNQAYSAPARTPHIENCKTEFCGISPW